MNKLIQKLIDYKWRLCEKHSLLIVCCEMVIQFVILALIIYAGIHLIGFLHS